LLLPFVNLFEPWGLLSHAVRIWDIVGEDQALKGEYKVISGKMCVAFRSFSSCVSFSQKINKFRNDLEWDGESKRIIAVGDGKEK
jgi:hypothetical protein